MKISRLDESVALDGFNWYLILAAVSLESGNCMLH